MSDKRELNKVDDLIVLDQESVSFMKERTEAHRLQFMPALIALLTGVFLLVVNLLRYFYPSFLIFSEPASWSVLALRQVIHLGVIPLLVLSIILLLYKPSSSLVAGHREVPLGIASGLWLGIISAFAYYVIIELLYRISWIDQVNNFIPSSLTIFDPFLSDPSANVFVVLSITVFLPTITLIPLILGLFLTPLLGSGKKILSIFFTCLFGALLPLDIPALFAYLLLWILLYQIYEAGSGLITAALFCSAYLITLTYAPKIFNLLSRRFIAWQSTSDLQGALLNFALLLIILILGLPGIIHFNLLGREQGRKQLSLSLQPHMIKHMEETKTRSLWSWILIAMALILILAALLIVYFT